jgi:hypothetical protein
MQHERNRRAEDRLDVALSVRVQGRNPDGTPWQQMTTIKDTSSLGVALVLPRVLPVGDVVQLSLRLPKRFRRYDFAEPTYNVHGVVRHAAMRPEGAVMGVLFLGKHAPRSVAAPKVIAPPEEPQDKRQAQRFDAFVNIRVRMPGVSGEAGQEELGVVTNIGLTGAALLTSLPVEEGQILDLQEIGGSFGTLAEVRHVSIGEGRVRHLSVHFVGDEARVKRFLKGLGINA